MIRSLGSVIRANSLGTLSVMADVTVELPRSLFEKRKRQLLVPQRLFFFFFFFNHRNNSLSF